MEKKQPHTPQENEPSPVLPQDVQSSSAPPSYEQVMGVNQSSVGKGEPELPPLAYIDIMPRFLTAGNIRGKIAPTFQKFSDIIAGANLWLAANPGLQCWKCETVERKVEDGPRIDLETMKLHQSTFGFNVYVLGLRMWLTKKQDNSPPQKLGLLNIVPNTKDIELKRSQYGSMFNTPEVMAMRRGMSSQTFTTFEGLKDTIARLNEDLKKNPLPEMEQFVPEIVKQAEIVGGTVFEHFTAALYRAQMWLQAQSGIKIVNIETREVRAFANMFTMQTEVLADSTDEFDGAFFQTQYVKIVRIFYVNQPEVTSYSSTLLTSRLFPPLRIGIKSFETMSQTMMRIVAWLCVTRLPIFGVETLRYPFVDNDHIGFNPDRSDYTIAKNTGKLWITAIRVYFPSFYEEPPRNMLPPAYDWLTQGEGRGSSTCGIL